MEAFEGPYRLREDAAWPPVSRAYGGEPQDIRTRYARPIRISTRLILPVTLLTIILASAYLYTDALLVLPAMPAAVQSAMLAVSDLILPLGWYALHLTNRRYGAPYALGQMLAAFGLLTLVALLNPGDVDHWINNNPALSLRAMLAFGACFLFANFLGLILFDAARGPRWWSAPLAASFAASLVFSVLYYPAAFLGVPDTSWANGVWVHFTLFFGESLLLLLPYHLLRPAMRPLYGMNGY